MSTKCSHKRSQYTAISRKSQTRERQMLVVSQYNNVQLSAPSNQSLSTRILVTKQHGASRGFSETAVAVFDKRNACTTPNAQSRNHSTTYSQHVHTHLQLAPPKNTIISFIRSVRPPASTQTAPGVIELFIISPRVSCFSTAPNTACVQSEAYRLASFVS